MQHHIYRVDPRMIPPVIMSMSFGAFLIFMEGATQKGIPAIRSPLSVLLPGSGDPGKKNNPQRKRHYGAEIPEISRIWIGVK